MGPKRVGQAPMRPRVWGPHGPKAQRPTGQPDWATERGPAPMAGPPPLGCPVLCAAPVAPAVCAQVVLAPR